MSKAYEEGPAFYATGKPSTWRDLRAVLHPPYTLWHLSYVVLGAMTAHHVNWTTLEGTLLAFFLAVGISAHVFDELRGRPLSTTLPSGLLWLSASLALMGAIIIGIIGVSRVGAWLVVFIVVGSILVLGYNLELFGGILHSDLIFAIGWGGFPVLTSAYAQQSSISWSAVVLAVAATILSAAQRSLSTPVRLLRREAVTFDGGVTFIDGTTRRLDRAFLLGSSERALRMLSWAVVTLAVSLVLARTAS